MIKKTLSNGKIASVGQFVTIVYNNEADYKAGTRKIEKCCDATAVWNRLVDGKYICGFCKKVKK